ncbi:SCF ubiquitin ligase complex subunit UFO1 SCDLUD_001295 [Saccharomycodes ludwigii]|uniref:SCF ubiquitin ligase complex subunit UFO1 n=1 Tax=Saccharomycodes ludwigii TaxID=36035 RepID=UPI001E898F6E|nr:hypothetical protein SCDLUD_001295 [Saccharomycodes ludwigii]KAH3903649.1 hypothetical protein SCDLUD_001295 [Saccharomycodes ludwigii]
MTNMAAKKLEDLPIELLLSIFSHLDHIILQDLQQTCKVFQRIIQHDDEIWKQMFISRINSYQFPNVSGKKTYKEEYFTRLRLLDDWKHNRGIKTKYTINTLLPQVQHNAHQLEHIVFDYPKCACYNEGVITLIQLNNMNRRKKNRLTYIPCTTPQGCSTINFNINAAVFGRYDGRIFGKLLTNKSYLSPVVEFDASHSSCVTAICTSSYQAADESNIDVWSCSGCANGEIIWWLNSNMRQSLKISTSPVRYLYMYNKNKTIAVDDSYIYVINEMTQVHILKSPMQAVNIQFIKWDQGGELLIIADVHDFYLISLNLKDAFGSTRIFKVDNGSIIQDVFIDETTSMRKAHQDINLAGEDGCYAGILTDTNIVYLINIRSLDTDNGETSKGGYLSIKPHLKLSFQEKIYTCQVNNLVLLIAFCGSISVYDANSGEEIRSIHKMEKYPQFLKLSHGRILVGSENVLHYLQYVDNGKLNKNHKKPFNSTRSSKWNEMISGQLEIYNDEVREEDKDAKVLDKLYKKFNGSVNDNEDIQLQIAMLESKTTTLGEEEKRRKEEEEEEMLRLAIEASMLDNTNGDFSDMCLEPLLVEQTLDSSNNNNNNNNNNNRSARERRRRPLGELEHVITRREDTDELDEETRLQLQTMERNTQANPNINTEIDNDLELALALSLSLSEIEN